MTVITPAGGSPETWAKNLADTSDYTIATANEARAFRIESILAACASGGSTFSLWISDGVTDVYLLNETAIAANDYLQLEHPLPLKSGWALKCKDHAGGKISVTAVLAITAKQTTG